MQYWDAHGGLPQQGFPISGEMSEVSETDGRTYTVQYFERAVFELHPENRPPNDILLSLLGSFAYRQKYPNGAPGMSGAGEPNTGAGSVRFPETGKRLGGVFLEYWRANGGLAQQGYPISDEFSETSELDGKTYTVQYFERAVFEYHPENKPPYDVLLSQLGTSRYQHKYAAGGDEWAALRARPLKLPALAPGSPCPATPGQVVAPEYGPALGNGPAYPVGLGTEGVLSLAGALEEGGWYYAKVLWVSAPAYSGPVLVRGKQLDGPNDLRFESGPDPAAERQLQVEADARSQSGWREWRSYTRLRGPGCYAYQVDGTSFSQVIVFRAATGALEGKLP